MPQRPAGASDLPEGLRSSLRADGGRAGTPGRQQVTFIILSLWLTLIFLFGGGARADIASLSFLRPISVLVLAYAIAGLSPAVLREHRFPLGMGLAVLLLPLLQLVPLPPQLWQLLTGRELLVEIGREAGLGNRWLPLTMAPAATWNALWALVAPLGVLVLGIQIDDKQRAALLPLLLMLGLASAVIGMLQMLGDPRSALYFYDITNNGAPVGLFANRNHQAVFLASLIPALFVWTAGQAPRAPVGGARMPRPVVMAALAAGATLLLLLILVSGSRSGMFTALIALLAVPFLVRDRSREPVSRPRQGWANGPALRSWLMPVCLAGLVGIAILLDRALAFDRLMRWESADEMRVRILPVMMDMLGLYLPWGTGLGSFEAVYQVHEPYRLLTSSYMNHAHNDWLELVLTGGVPAMLLLAIAATALVLRLKNSVSSKAMGRRSSLEGLALVIILILFVASITDYPLRTPSMSCLLSVAFVWLFSGTNSLPGRASRPWPGGEARIQRWDH